MLAKRGLFRPCDHYCRVGYVGQIIIVLCCHSILLPLAVLAERVPHATERMVFYMRALVAVLAMW